MLLLNWGGFLGHLLKSDNLVIDLDHATGFNDSKLLLEEFYKN
jgi:hypothetical protein